MKAVGNLKLVDKHKFKAIDPAAVEGRDLHYLTEYSEIIRDIDNPPIGREQYMKDMDAYLQRPKMNSVALLGPAGVGKTALVEGYAQIHEDDHMLIFNVDLPTMAGDGQDKFAERVHGLAEDIRVWTDYMNSEKVRAARGYELITILFLDEMHLLTENGAGGTGGGSSAGNAIKPILARGKIRVIGATTDEEFDRYIRPDQALTRRFQTIQLPEPDDLTVKNILYDFAVSALGKKVADRIIAIRVYDEIVDYTNRFQPSLAQPAKAIDIMDGLIGFYRAGQTKVINHALLAHVFQEKLDVNVDWKTNITKVMKDIRKRVMGQDRAIDLLENRLHVANAGLQDPGRPMANLLFAGATGVGKTELVKAVASAMFGSENKIIRFDMSEYPLAKDVATFKERISDKIRKQPYAVVLLDEFEKADRGIMNLMLAVLDDGRLSDRYGRQTTFTNAIIVITTNAASDTFKEASQQGLTNEQVSGQLSIALGDVFTPEFLGRFDEIIPFNTLDADAFKAIAKIQLQKQVDKVKEKYMIPVSFTDDVLIYLVNERFAALNDASAGGGRAMKRRIEREVTPLLAKAIDVGKDENVAVRAITVSEEGEMYSLDKTKMASDSHLRADFVLADRRKGWLTVNDNDPHLSSLLVNS